MGFRQTLRAAFTLPSQADLERAYLDRSVSRADLERRQREIDEGLLRPRRFGF